MIKSTDTLMLYSFEKNGVKDELYVTINNDKNNGNSFFASAFSEDYTLISEVKSSDRNLVGYALIKRLKGLGYNMIEFRISNNREVLIDLMLKNNEQG